MDMVLNAWQCAFLGAVGGLLFAAVFWFLFGKSTDIFFNAEYKSSLIGSIVLGVIYALALYHCFNSCLWLIPSGLSILFWNLAVLYVHLRDNFVKTVWDFCSNKTVWLVFLFCTLWLLGVCFLLYLALY